MQAIIVILILALLAGCAPGRYGPIQINPQDEKLFAKGLEQFRAGEPSPQPFQHLSEEYPESLFTQAASTLLECSRTRGELQAQNGRLAIRQKELERQATRALAARDACREQNSAIAGQLDELEANLEKFKQILLETEQRTP